MRWTLRELTPTFGAEITGFDLGREHGAVEIAEIRRLWQRHQLLLFRGQSLGEPDLVRFSATLGPLEIHLRTEYLSRENPQVLYVSNIVENGRRIGILSDNEVGWHYDQIYLPKPAVGSLLHAVVLPERGGNTYFADMSAAYERLPDDVKARLEGRRAVQSYEAFNRVYSVPTSEVQKRKSADIDQPMVRTHPYTGRRALYLCPGMTTRVLDMDEDESDALLQFLFEWAVREEFVYMHVWQPGDALLWDNASTMHRRDPFDPTERRLMKRTTILPDPSRAVPV